jgi:hypothetical protein
MRALFGVLVLLGVAGIVAGTLTIIRGIENAPFAYETYGGPGPMIGGLLLLSIGLYLLSVWPRIESRAEHHM